MDDASATGWWPSIALQLCRTNRSSIKSRDRSCRSRDFLGRLGIEDGIPDGTTLWLFREILAKARSGVEKLFERFGQHLEAKGYIRPGSLIVLMPRSFQVPQTASNSRDEND